MLSSIFDDRVSESDSIVHLLINSLYNSYKVYPASKNKKYIKNICKFMKTNKYLSSTYF